MRVLLVVVVMVFFFICSCSTKREYIREYCFPTRIVVIDTTMNKLDIDNLFYLFSKYNADTIISGNKIFTMHSQDWEFEIIEH